MTYTYSPDDIDHDGAPVSATCDFCDMPIDMDEAQNAEEGMTSHRGIGYMEHCCSECRVLGNRERYDHERAHSRERLG